MVHEARNIVKKEKSDKCQEVEEHNLFVSVLQYQFSGKRLAKLYICGKSKQIVLYKVSENLNSRAQKLRTRRCASESFSGTDFFHVSYLSFREKSPKQWHKHIPTLILQLQDVHYRTFPFYKNEPFFVSSTVFYGTVLCIIHCISEAALENIFV